MKQSETAPFGLNLSDIFPAALVLGLAYGLKLHYSTASSDELTWILGPLAWIVENLTGVVYHAERGAGYVSADSMIIIAPICAGINFLIALLLCGSGLVIMTPAGLQRKINRLFLIVVTSYLFGLLVNGLRIVLAIELFGMDIYTGVITEGRLHRLAGILVYFPALLLYGAVVQTMIRNHHRNSLPGCCLLLYLGVCLGVPLLTGSFLDHPARYVEHGLTLVICCLLCVGAWGLVTGSLRKHTIVGK